MFKEISSAISKFLNRKELVVGVIVLLIAFFLLSYSSSKTVVQDTLEDGYGASSAPTSYSDETNRLAKQPTVRETGAQNIVDPAPASSEGYDMKPVNSPSELLPTDVNSDFAKLNPSMNAGATPDLLQAGYHIGLDTISSSLRNANRQIRSEPTIPKADVGPWMQSTIEPDLMRVPLEIGYGGR